MLCGHVGRVDGRPRHMRWHVWCHVRCRNVRRRHVRNVRCGEVRRRHMRRKMRHRQMRCRYVRRKMGCREARCEVRRRERVKAAAAEAVEAAEATAVEAAATKAAPAMETSAAAKRAEAGVAASAVEIKRSEARRTPGCFMIRAPDGNPPPLSCPLKLASPLSRCNWYLCQCHRMANALGIAAPTPRGLSA